MYQNKYLFDLRAPKKLCGPRKIIRNILGYANVPIFLKGRHEIISTTFHYMEAYYFLRYLRAVFEKKLPFLDMDDTASKYRFIKACEELEDETVREVNE